MIILEILLKNFGKFNQKKIEFQEGINLIYGENEAGKSTIHTFIKGMLFGIEKQRGRASKNDVYSLYEPWENPVFFEGVLRFEEDGQVYKVQRKFHRLAKEFNIINETIGKELTEEDFEKLIPWLNETTYGNTISISQLKGATDGEIIGELNNYIANLNTTSNMELDIGKATRFLKKKKKGYEAKFNFRAEEAVARLEGELTLLEQEIEGIGIKKEELEEEDHAFLDHEIEVEKPNENRKSYLSSIFGMVIFFVIGVGLYTFTRDKYKVLLMLSGIMFFLSTGTFLWGLRQFKNRIKSGKKEKDEIEEKNKILKNQIHKLEWKMEQLQESVVRIQSSLAEYELIKNENKKISEEVEAIDLALATIQDISLNIKHGFGDMVNNQTSKLVEKFTNGKYKDLKVDENLGVKINHSEKLIPLEQVSKGTAEQIYLALRLAIADVLFGNKAIPIILDDAFAMYDEKRLVNTLKQLEKMNRQILIFTCHKREKRILESFKIPHNYIELT